MSGKLVKDKVPAIKRDVGIIKPIMVLDKMMFGIEIQRKLASDYAHLQYSLSQQDRDLVIRDIAEIQLCLKHLCESLDISQSAVEHVYALMHQQEGGYDSRLYQMDEKKEDGVAGVQAETRNP